MSRKAGTVVCVLNWEGGNGAYCCNREGETAWGGWNGIGRVILLRIFPGRGFVADVITLQRRYDPPGLESYLFSTSYSF